MSNGLNERRDTFARELAKGNVCQAEAARRAGYKEGRAHVTGSELAANSNVIEQVERYKQQEADKSKGILSNLERSSKSACLASDVLVNYVEKIKADGLDDGQVIAAAGQLQALQKLNLENIERVLSLQEKYDWGKDTGEGDKHESRAHNRKYYRMGRISAFSEVRKRG